jgi:hypothetical protein
LAIKKGVFWGVSAGWEITKEGFWENIGANNIFSSFRLKGSYGKVGNVSGIGNFQSLSTLDQVCMEVPALHLIML